MDFKFQVWFFFFFCVITSINFDGNFEMKVEIFIMQEI